MMKLTEKMKEALVLIAYGVRGYENGFCSEEDTSIRLDLRSAAALHRRGLIFYYTTGGAPIIRIIEPTKEGWRIFEEDLR